MIVSGLNALAKLRFRKAFGLELFDAIAVTLARPITMALNCLWMAPNRQRVLIMGAAKVYVFGIIWARSSASEDL